MKDGEDKVIKAATNEWVLLSWRTVVMALLTVATWVAHDIRTGQDRANVEITKLAMQFNDFRLTNEARISKVEGEVGLLRGSVETHRKRLEGNDNDIRSIWSRIFDMRPTQPPRGGNP